MTVAAARAGVAQDENGPFPPGNTAPVGRGPPGRRCGGGVGEGARDPVVLLAARQPDLQPGGLPKRGAGRFCIHRQIAQK